MFIDALHVKIRDGQVGPRPIYAATSLSVSRSLRAYVRSAESTQRV